MDATSPLRRLLKRIGLHDYDSQSQGPSSKVTLPAIVHGQESPKTTQASLYRPETKQGDPRIWFYGLKTEATPGDVLAIIPHDAHLHLVNLTQLDVARLSTAKGHSLNALFADILSSTSKVSDELLGRLRELAARGPIPSVIKAPADTAIGRTLEHELGIAMNSKQAPDYKGIELKSYRKRGNAKQVRKTLFAQVPDWSLSKLKSSAEILEAFGYERDGAFKLYCQVEAKKRNSQGLMLRLDSEADHLLENSDQAQYGDFAIWPLERLRSKLLEKHGETFWVGATQILDQGREFFSIH